METSGYISDCDDLQQSLSPKTFIKDGRLKVISHGQYASESFFYEELMGKFFKEIALKAEKIFKSSVKKLVVIVPSSFNEAQRITYINAAKFAELEISLLDETTALAIAYGVKRENKERFEKVLVCSSRSGELSTSIVNIFENVKYSVEAYSSDQRKLNGEIVLDIMNELQMLLSNVEIKQSEIKNVIVAGLKLTQIKFSNETFSIHSFEDPTRTSVLGGAYHSSSIDDQNLEIEEVINVNQQHSKQIQLLLPNVSLIRCDEKQTFKMSFYGDQIVWIATEENGILIPIKIKGNVKQQLKFHYDSNKILHITSINMCTSDDAKCFIDDDTTDSSNKGQNLELLISKISLTRCNEVQTFETSFYDDEITRIVTGDKETIIPVKIRGKVKQQIKFHYDSNKNLNIDSINMSTIEDSKCFIDDGVDLTWDKDDLDALIRNTSERHHDERRIQSLNDSGELGQKILKLEIRRSMQEHDDVFHFE